MSMCVGVFTRNMYPKMYDSNDMTSIISLITSYVFLFFGQSVIFLCPFIGFLQTLHFGGCLSLTFFFIVT